MLLPTFFISQKMSGNVWKAVLTGNISLWKSKRLSDCPEKHLFLRAVTETRLMLSVQQALALLLQSSGRVERVGWFGSRTNVRECAPTSRAAGAPPQQSPWKDGYATSATRPWATVGQGQGSGDTHSSLLNTTPGSLYHCAMTRQKKCGCVGD